MPKPSLRDRTRAMWNKTWSKHKDKIIAHQRVYLQKRYKKVVADKLAGNRPMLPKAEVLFDGRVAVLKLACVVCDTAFIVEKSRSNHRPKLCPVCQASCMAMQKDEYQASVRPPKKKPQENP